ncbi:MT-A70-domain-containing protein [Lojkania enalia]|uniref:MT-A70-domain-containing protein n=1 Tax=Lojkania enalia TaxID=147567 RepID=A0A9P4K9B5_9PLEO|nr:MT-A70-domain-containing protein [Didymosphaeria enalia]
MDKRDKAASQTGILYQNKNHDVTLMDIPTSIAVAQGRSDVLRSIRAIDEPYDIRNEPKTEKAKAHHAQYTGSSDLHAEYLVAIDKALAEIRHHVSGSWCVPRKLMTQAPKRRNNDMDVDDPEKELEQRLREWAASKGEEEPFDFNMMMTTLITSGLNAILDDPVTPRWLVSCKPAREIAGSSETFTSVSPKEPWTTSFHNSNDRAVDLTVSPGSFKPETSNQEYCFRIPARSTFFLSDSTHSDSFRASFRELTEEYTLPRHFDFVLLDPPWPSGSVKRKGAYEQFGGMPYMKKTLLKMDIDNYLEHNGLLAIWITNSPTLRQMILGPEGLFQRWNVSFFEEWIWIKTTTTGEPMYCMDKVWRKPYETLLLARAAPNSWTKMETAPIITRKIIAAVPDIHSRKPCLKELIEPYLPTDYSALEVFSRYLVKGWTSWGNEVIKFNWDHYWAADFEPVPSAIQTSP